MFVNFTFFYGNFGLDVVERNVLLFVINENNFKWILNEEFVDLVISCQFFHTEHSDCCMLTILFLPPPPVQIMSLLDLWFNELLIDFIVLSLSNLGCILLLDYMAMQTTLPLRKNQN